MSGRIDVLSIFPEYLAPLDLSLVGRARRENLLELDVHDLRQWTTDAHRTVDDTPYGGGAGMVMRADVWGHALDDVLVTGDHPSRTVVIPTPAGSPLTQQIAEELALMVCAGGQLVLACGRYEGLDARIAEHYGTREAVSVREVSIGDYVLNGGEAAALVIIEAVARLLPGVVGNPESLVEESHGSGGLLEYPVYTRPERWRDLEVPPVLRSGDHARIRRWRRAEAVSRTASRRPDLLAQVPVTVRPARAADIGELADVAARTFPLACPPHTTADSMQDFVATNLSAEALRDYLRDRRYSLLVGEIAQAVVGYVLVVHERPGDEAVRAVISSEPCAEVSKIYVLPEHHGRGVGDALISAAIERARQRGARSLWLGVNQLNERAQRFYRRHGFVRIGTRTFQVGAGLESDYVMELTE